MSPQSLWVRLNDALDERPRASLSETFDRVFVAMCRDTSPSDDD